MRTAPPLGSVLPRDSDVLRAPSTLSGRLPVVAWIVSGATPSCAFTNSCDKSSWLLGWLRRNTGNSSDAADLAHDRFVRIPASRHLPESLEQEPRALPAHIAKGLLSTTGAGRMSSAWRWERSVAKWLSVSPKQPEHVARKRESVSGDMRKIKSSKGEKRI